MLVDKTTGDIQITETDKATGKVKKNLFARAWGGIKNFALKVYNWIKEFFKSLGSKAKRAWNKLFTPANDENVINEKDLKAA